MVKKKVLIDFFDNLNHSVRTILSSPSIIRNASSSEEGATSIISNYQDSSAEYSYEQRMSIQFQVIGKLANAEIFCHGLDEGRMNFDLSLTYTTKAMSRGNANSTLLYLWHLLQRVQHSAFRWMLSFVGCSF